MAKLYTLDHKLLTETPEIRIGEKIYAVDNRQKTVKKIQEAAKAIGNDDPYSGIETVLELALGRKAAQEIDDLDMPYPAYQTMIELVMAAVTGEEPEEVGARFQGEIV
ncbi:MAG: hypothetical protein IJ960_06735 [Oscillospiraceae bacterium]|nr:hypothetical protein [Oscillospiraceae bacterium]